jgi:heptose-I-phosphate ethanolaminephosphotransferase
MLAREAGFRIHWLSNQPPNDGWLGLVSRRADEQVFINKGSGRGENNFDGNLLPALETALQDPAPKKLIVVHLLGASYLRHALSQPVRALTPCVMA